jgi:5-methyltetrahydropteroyltriglutamate--homocysteine methyltransferase
MRRGLKHLPVSGLHLEAVRAPEQVAEFALDYPHDNVLSLGVIDGRNVWRCDLSAVLSTLEPVKERLGSRLWIAPSCSLLHCPMDMGCESALDGEAQGLARVLDPEAR